MNEYVGKASQGEWELPSPGRGWAALALRPMGELFGVGTSRNPECT